MVFNDAASLNIGHNHVNDLVVVINAFFGKRGGVDISFLHLTLLVLSENPDLHIRHFVRNDFRTVFVTEISNVDIGMFGTVWLQDLGAEPDLIFHQNTAVVDFVFAIIHQIVCAEVRVGNVVVEHLIRKLIGYVHRFAQDDSLSISSIAPSDEIPFHTRRLAELLIRQLCIHYTCASRNCCQ